MAFDPIRGRTVLFSGGDLDGPPAVQETWEWDGSTWRNVQPLPPRPPARLHSMMAFDPSRGKVVLFGGATDTQGTTVFDDTWTWDGTTWVPISTGARPTPRWGSAMAFDAARYNDTWVFGTPRPAAWYAFGAGCPTATPLSLSVDARPVVGSSVNVLLSGFALDGHSNEPRGTRPCARAENLDTWAENILTADSLSAGFA